MHAEYNCRKVYSINRGQNSFRVFFLGMAEGNRVRDLSINDEALLVKQKLTWAGSGL